MTIFGDENIIIWFVKICEKMLIYRKNCVKMLNEILHELSKNEMFKQSSIYQECLKSVINSERQRCDSNSFKFGRRCWNLLI